MANKMTFNELQNKMNIKKQKGQAVSYSYRSAEQILEHFKTLDSGWEVILTDDIDGYGDKLFIRSYAIARCGDIEREAVGFAELSEVPILKLKAGGEKKQMSEPQWTGAVSSYARKYALQGLFGIADIDVDELELQQEIVHKKEEAKTRDFVSEIQKATKKTTVVKIAKEAKEVGMGRDILAAYTEKMKEFEKAPIAESIEVQVEKNIEWVNKHYKPEIDLIKSWQAMAPDKALDAIKEYVEAMKLAEKEAAK